MRNSIRFYQSLNLLKHSYTLSNKSFLNKIILKSNSNTGYTMAVLKKGVFLNKSLYVPRLFQGFLKIFYNTQIGLIAHNTLNTSIGNEDADSGLITDLTHSYATGLKKNNTPNVLVTKNLLFNRFFLQNMHITKQLRKIIIMSVLISFKK